MGFQPLPPVFIVGQTNSLLQPILKCWNVIEILFDKYYCYWYHTDGSPAHLFLHLLLVLKLLLFPPHPLQTNITHSPSSLSHLNLVSDPPHVPLSSAKLQESFLCLFLAPAPCCCFCPPQYLSHSDQLKKLLLLPEHPPYWKLYSEVSLSILLCDDLPHAVPPIMVVPGDPATAGPTVRGEVTIRGWELFSHGWYCW